MSRSRYKVPPKLRAEILVRDRWTCQKCKSRKPADELQVAHLIPRDQGGLDVPGNVRALCLACHGREGAEYDGTFGNPVKMKPEVRAMTPGKRNRLTAGPAPGWQLVPQGRRDR